MNEQPLPAAKRERPRDVLGRPLPWGSTNLLPLDSYDAYSPERNHKLAIEAFGRGAFFIAHEAWEAAWRQTKGTADEPFFKTLAQVGAGYTHWRRGNPHGARVLLERAARALAGCAPEAWGIDVPALIDLLRAHARAFGAWVRGEPAPQLEPHLPRAGSSPP